jgi:hypothetical protein
MKKYDWNEKCKVYQIWNIHKEYKEKGLKDAPRRSSISYQIDAY